MSSPAATRTGPSNIPSAYIDGRLVEDELARVEKQFANCGREIDPATGLLGLRVWVGMKYAPGVSTAGYPTHIPLHVALPCDFPNNPPRVTIVPSPEFSLVPHPCLPVPPLGIVSSPLLAAFSPGTRLLAIVEQLATLFAATLPVAPRAAPQPCAATLPPEWASASATRALAPPPPPTPPHAVSAADKTLMELRARLWTDGLRDAAASHSAALQAELVRAGAEVAECAALAQALRADAARARADADAAAAASGAHTREMAAWADARPELEATVAALAAPVDAVRVFAAGRPVLAEEAEAAAEEAAWVEAAEALDLAVETRVLGAEQWVVELRAVASSLFRARVRRMKCAAILSAAAAIGPSG